MLLLFCLFDMCIFNSFWTWENIYFEDENVKNNEFWSSLIRKFLRFKLHTSTNNFFWQFLFVCASVSIRQHFEYSGLVQKLMVCTLTLISHHSCSSVNCLDFSHREEERWSMCKKLKVELLERTLRRHAWTEKAWN